MTATTTAPPRNLAQLKRFLTPGMQLVSTFHGWAAGGALPLETHTLTIERVNTVDIIFAPHPQIGGGRQNLYHRIAKAGCYRFTATGFDLLDHDGRVITSYRYPATDTEA